jgi:hypothetical protein
MPVLKALRSNTGSSALAFGRKEAESFLLLNDLTEVRSGTTEVVPCYKSCFGTLFLKLP